MTGRVLRAAALALGVLLPGRSYAQPVMLEIRPAVGDTVHLRLEQTVEMKATTRVGARDSTMSTTTRMEILARAIILASDSAGTRVLAITDSVNIGEPGAPAGARDEQSRRELEGARVQMRVLPDGSSAIIPGERERMTELQALMGQMPSTLPRTPVQVGERWSRVVTVPIDGGGGVSRTESLKTTFRFDSLSRNREVAHISLLGEISRPAADSADGAQKMEITGTIRGGLTVDRARGWMTDSRAVITLKSVRQPPAGSKAHPMHFELTITQRMRALDKR